MKVIGFAGQFYTLWEVSKPYRVYVNQHSFYMKTDYTYYKNLSMDLEKAKKKMGDSKYGIDLNLKGTGSWSFEAKDDIKFDRSKVDETVVPYDINSLKNYAGRTILKLASDDDCKETEIKKLWCLYLKKDTWNNSVECHSFKKLKPHWVRPVVYARRRLIQLGLLERYKGAYYSPNYIEILKQKEDVESAKNELQTGYHFNEKDRVELEIKEIESFGFEGMYGYTHIVTYASKCGKLLKYIGGSPKDISNADFVKVKATIKHEEYKGFDETKLQRISILK